MDLITNLEIHVTTLFDDRKKIKIAKRKFLREQKEVIQNCISDGYQLKEITQVLTIELLKTKIVKSYTLTNKKGAQVIRKTEYKIKEIKEYLEINDKK
jgi:hypothetical protein